MADKWTFLLSRRARSEVRWSHTVKPGGTHQPASVPYHVGLTMRLLRTSPIAVVVATLVIASPLAASGLVAGGGVVPNTSTQGLTAQLSGPPTVVRKLHVPGSPADDSPSAVAALGSPASPNDDLIDALDGLAGATDTAAAVAARSRALDILEGNPIAGRAYSGIPLLNWNAPARVKTVPAGGTVTVNEARFGERIISDTSLLEFADPNQAFSIAYRVAELGAIGGVFSPAPLLADGTTPVGGLASVVVPLALANLPTDTRDTNRFHPGGAAELTRAAVQELVVKMPPPNLVTAILDPDVAPGHVGLATLAPATPARLATLQAQYGFAGLAPTAAEKAQAIGRLSAAAPAKMLWTALSQLDPADPAFVAAANAAGTQNRPLVDGLTTRTTIPAGVPVNAAATLNVAVLAGDAFVSHTSIAPHGTATISVTNGDGFPRTFAVRALRDRKPVHGAIDWGQFAWTASSTTTLAAGETRTINVATGATTFALWVGDPDGGDQAGQIVTVETGPMTRSFEFPNPLSAPGHFAQDTTGHLWIALAGIDTIARLTPTADVASTGIEEFRIPGGNFTANPAVLPLAPHDITFDSHGIAWITLAVGNAIARLDPAAVHAGTTDGITVFPLPPCNLPLPACAPPLPPEPAGLPLRNPNQLEVLTAVNGDTIIWFTESGANEIGAMRVAPNGALVAQADIPCGCQEPMGIALDARGGVWFSSLVGNEVVRMTPSLSKPFDAKRAVFDRFPIPSSVTIIDPAHPAPGIESAGAHSLAIDPAGRVWVTEEETGKLGFLDPATATPGSTAGFVEFPLGTSDFGAVVAPADLAIDASGTVFWVDEYGDVVGSVSAQGVVNKFRPVDRASLTDAPFIDAQGNFWFVEAATNRLTRLSQVAEPTPVPSPPATLTADLGAHAINGEGLAGSTSVDVDVTVGSTSVAHIAAVPVTTGAFSVPVPALTGGALARVTRHGPHPQVPLQFTVASMQIATNTSGQLSGQVLVNDQPNGEDLSVTAGTTTVSVTPGPNGEFHTAMPTGSPGTIAAATATAAAVFRTIATFAPATVNAPAVKAADPTAAGDQRIVDTINPPQSTNAPSIAPDRATTPVEQACNAHLWLTNGTVALLGATKAQLTKCFGQPTRVKRTRSGALWVFGRSFDVHLHNDVVTALTLRDATLRTDPADVGVGSATWRLSQALPKLRFDRRTRTFRAVVPVAGEMFADIRATSTRQGKIARVSITRSTRRALDRFARRLI